MGERNGDRVGLKGTSSIPEYVRRSRNGRGNRKSEMKVKLSHAMNQIAIDVKQAIEQYGRETGTIRPSGE